MPLKPLLFLSPRVPWPLNTGAKIRTHALLTALLERYAVHYFGFLQPDLPREGAEAMLQSCASVTLRPEPARTASSKGWLALRTLLDARPVTIAKYWDGPLAGAVNQLLAGLPGALLHADHLHMAPYLFHDGAAHAALRVLDEHNVESQIVERAAEQYAGRPHAPYLRLQAGRMRAFEARTVARADLTLAVSGGDAAALASLARPRRVEVIPNGVDLEYFHDETAGPGRRPGRLVFTGSMNWLPNQDAMVYFVNEILPLLDRHPAGLTSPARPARPAYAPPWTLDVVGLDPPPPVRALASERVRVTGTVPDVRPFIREALLYVVPLRIGGGSRLKILEAFAMGIPVVSTTIGCEGLEVEHERQLLIADTPEAFAQAVVRLAVDPGLGRALTERALAHVRERFSWPAIGRKLVALYEEAADPGGRPPARAWKSC